MGSKLEIGVNDLETLYPEIAAEWDHGKNAGFSPGMILPGSGKKVWWKCRYGHEWKTAVYHRTEGHGCKVCASRKAVLKPGINDLATKSPLLSSQWDHEKNYPLTPSDVPHYSQAKVWWRCSKGHSWQTTVGHRVCGEGCPYCSGNRILPGYNDLVTLNAGFLGEWDYEKNTDVHPEEIGPGSEQKIWWKCSAGHSWEAVVYSRSAGTGCPYCAGNTVLKGLNDLESTMPEIAGEWDLENNGDILPGMVARTSARSYWWKCPKGHRYRSSPGSRARGCGCLYCAGKKVLKGFNDFQSRHPELMPEWDWDRNAGKHPDEIVCNHHKKVWWKDSLGHSWKATTSDRIKGSGCPYCAGRLVLKGFNDLETCAPDIAVEWDIEKNADLLPTEVTCGNNRPVWWRCSNGHSWKVRIASRTGKKTACPYCSNRKVLKGFNDFAFVHPELVTEWNDDKNEGKTPSDYTYGSHKTVWWICPEGHEYRRSLDARHRGRGCPYCAGSKVLPGFNDLKTRTPWTAESWDYERNRGFGPADVFPFSNRKVWWVCDRGHHWRATINARQSGAGCPYCHGLLPGKTHFIS